MAHTLVRSVNGAFQIDGNLYPKDKVITLFPVIDGVQCMAIDDLEGNTILSPTDISTITVDGSDGFGVEPDVARQWAIKNLYTRKDSDSIYRALTSVGDNAANVSALPADITQIVASNNSSVPLYVKLYDHSGIPDELSTPVLTIAIPSKTAGANVCINLANSVPCFDGIGIRITTGLADGDTSPTGDDDGVVQVWYNLRG